MPHATRWVAAAALVLAALCLRPTAPWGWGGADHPDGTRFKVSLVGLSHVLDLRRTVSPTRECRWSPPGGDIDLCRVRAGGEGAFARLRALGSGLRAAVGLAVVAAALTLVPRAPLRVRVPVTLAAALAPVAIMVLFAASAGSAVAVLEGLPFGLAATRATMHAMLAILLGLAAAGLQAERLPRSAIAVAAVVIAAVAPFVGLRFGGWPGATIGMALSAGVLLAPLWRDYGSARPTSLAAGGSTLASTPNV